MAKHPKILLLAGALFIAGFTAASSAGNKMPQSKSGEAKKTSAVTSQKAGEPQIYFIELGSVRCIPCRQMQPVMKNIEAKYSPRVKVIFYDVWTAEQSKYAKLYNIRVIPTQVFLDKSRKEIFRHQGFFPQKDLEQFLADHGVKPVTE